MMKFYAKKGKSPLLCRELLRNPRKEQKQAHLNRTVKGCFYQFRHLLKRKTPVFALHTLHRSYHHCSYLR